MALSEETKYFLTSKGVWGGIIAVVAGIAGLLGYVVSPEDQASLEALVAGIVSAVGGIVAIYGRIKATQKVTVK